MSQPPRQGLPGWTIALLIGSVLLIVLPVVSLAIAGFSAYRVFNPAAASDTPPEPDFDGFDVCSLITPRDAERAGARSDRFGPEEVTVVELARKIAGAVPA